MPVEYVYDKEKKVIDTNAYGIVTVSEIVKYLHTLMADEHIQFGSIEIFSLENAEDLVMSYTEVQVFKDLWAQYKKRIGQTVLVVAPSELSYGVFRMLATSVALADDEAGEAFRLLRSRDELGEYL